tara:strand:+ start:65 stop:1246 length:1182 start_codon:yes stop_codon:yes gene_type:complete
LFDFVEILCIDKPVYDRFRADSAQFAKDKIFAMEGAEPAGDTGKFFQQLSMSPQLRWDVFVSSEYLGLTYLIGEAENSSDLGAKLASFGNEIADSERMLEGALGSSGLQLNGIKYESVDRLTQKMAELNPNYKGRSHRDTLQKIVFGYGWAAERSKFYEMIASYNDMAPVLSPLRDAYCLSVIGVNPMGAETTFLSAASRNSIEMVQEVSKSSDCTALRSRVPFFTSALLSKCRDVKEALHYALDLREKEEFRESREILRELAGLKGAKHKSAINKLIMNLENLNRKLLEKYSVITPNGPSVSLNVSLLGPSIGFSEGFSKFFGGITNKNNPILRIYRSMAIDLVAVERLGVLYERATCLVDKHPQAGFASHATIPSYMRGRSNQYGRPVEEE